MEELGKVYQLLVPVGGYTMTFNLNVIVMTWIVIGLLFLFGYTAARKRSRLPGPMQVVGELLVSNLYSVVEDALDKELSRKYAPLICALFMFLVISNWLGIIPNLSEPTKDLNTTLSLGLMGFCIAHYAGIRAKGIKTYIKGYFEPIFFYDAAESDWGAVQSGFHLLPSFRQYHGRINYHYGRILSDMECYPSAFSEYVFRTVCRHGAGICVHNAHVGLHLNTGKLDYDFRYSDLGNVIRLYQRRHCNGIRGNRRGHR